jgi:hypothetical protein
MDMERLVPSMTLLIQLRLSLLHLYILMFLLILILFYNQ